MKRFLKDLLIPSRQNAYAPRALRKAAVVGMTLMVFVTFAVANIQSIVWITSDWMVSTILPSVIVTDTNEEREGNAVAPLQRSAVLDAAATLKAEHMAEGQYFAHFSPDGVSPWYWFNEVGYNFVHAGENLAIYFTDSSEIVDAWMDSPTHRANILNGNYQEIGIGVARGVYDGYDTVYVVQLFGTQRAEPGALSAVTTTTEEVDLTIASTETNTEPAVAGIESDREPQATMHIAEDETVALYLEHVATTTSGTPALIESIRTDDLSGNARLWAVATQPSMLLQITYMILASFVFIALVLSILIDVRRQHPRQIAYGMGLVAIMFLLFQLHIAISNGILIA